MKAGFEEFYTPTPEEFKTLWETCFFSFDTNVLLDLYRFHDAARGAMLSLMEHVASRVWLPHQVALEFHRSRPAVVAEFEQTYDALTDRIQAFAEKVKQDFPRHPHLDIARICATIQEATKAISDARSAHRHRLNDDDIRERLVAIFGSRTGTEPTDVKNREEQARKRIKERVPPGYEDAGKDGDGSLGDVLLWLELVARCQELKQPLILVTSERKDDWFWRKRGRTFGPRPELRREVLDSAGVDFHLYRWDQFEAHAREFLGWDNPGRGEAAKELEERRERQRTNAEERRRLIQRVRLLQAGADLPALFRLQQIAREDEEKARALAKISGLELWRGLMGAAPVSVTDALEQMTGADLLELFQRDRHVTPVDLRLVAHAIAARDDFNALDEQEEPEDPDSGD